jgi:hypothetical protein
MLTLLGCLSAALMATGIISAFNSWLNERKKSKTLAISGAVAYVVILAMFMLNN